MDHAVSGGLGAGRGMTLMLRGTKKYSLNLKDLSRTLLHMKTSENL